MTHSTDKNPGTPTPGDNAATTTEIVWNWNTVDGATGYKWNTINDYASAIPTIGNATFHTETGLTCNTAYTSYAWAVGACGNSAPLTMTKTTATNPVPPLQGAHIATTNSINWDWVAVPNATGYKWNTINDFASGIDINTTSHLETGLSCNTAYTSYAWAIGGCGHSVPVTLADSTLSITPAAPSAATHFATQNAITWHWNTVTTASGYKWNTLNDFSTATDMGTATSNLEQGLTCNTLFTRYVWAYNTCGVSQSTPLTTSTTSTNVASPAPGTHLVQPTTIQWHWNSVSGATGYKWSTNTNYAQATDMGTIITKTETTLTCNIIYTSYVWASSDCGISPPVSMTQTSSPNIPNTPITGNHTPGITQIVWNWNTVSNATGYKWNTTNNFSSAIDLGANATKTETGLTCNTSYTRYAWAYGPCGNSEPVTLNMTTLMNPPATPTVGNLIPSPNQIVWNWNTVAGATGYKWNTTDNFSTATDNGTATSKTETGLTCNSAYTRYAWAYSNCGNSLQPLIMAKSTTIFTPQPPVAGNHISQITQIEWKWEAVIGATGYKWNTSNDYASATDIPTGTSKIEIGLICNSAYTRFVWAYGACNGLSTATTLSASTSPNAPSTPTAGNHVPSLTQIVWNWTPVTNVTGYKWNSTNNFSTAIDMGTLTTFTETGLSCGTPCTRYVWSYNNCGYDLPVVLTQTTTACFSCGNNITITHVTSGGVAPVNKTVTYGTVTNIPGEAGKCWITSNLGSDHQATAVDDATEASSGWFWQFNRKKGYKHTGSVITPTWPTAGITENSDWTSANDPCTLEIGSGWRIPTITEWTNVDGAGNWNSWSEPWASGLKMHAAGALYPSFPAAGVLIERGVSGYYWSSTQALVGYADARFLYFYSTNSTIIYYNKPYGMTLRCIKNF